MLPGSTTKVLQEIMELNTTLNACLKQEERLVVPYLWCSLLSPQIIR